MATVKDIYLADKRIGFFPGWSKAETETDYIWFDAPIEIEGVAQTGLVLHGGCFAHRPQEHVSLELRIGRTPGKQCTPVERIDWRCLGHSNPRRPPSDWAGKRVSETHLHDFWLNWYENEQRLRLGGLQTAREIEEEKIEDFEQLRAFAGNRLRINNIEVVETPPWVYDLFIRGGF